MNNQKSLCDTFLQLHRNPGVFVIPNPWDPGSARLLQQLGFQALATTSAGLAYTLGKKDGEISLTELLNHNHQLTKTVNIPVSVDFENGFADDPQQLAENVRLVVETGVAGCSIEDFSRTSHTIYDFDHSLERIQAVVEVVQALDMPFQLTARAENLLRGVADLDDTIKRLQAYQSAGANVLYAPGISSLTDLQYVTSQISLPFNVLAPMIPGATVDSLADAGAKRISLGAALNWVAVNPVLAAAREMLDAGSFTWASSMGSREVVAALFAGDLSQDNG